MRLLLYKDLDLQRVKSTFAKDRTAIEEGDLKSPDVEKLHVGGDCRDGLDHGNRLLPQFARLSSVNQGEKRKEPVAAAGRTPGQRHQADIELGSQCRFECQQCVGQLTTALLPRDRLTANDRSSLT